MAGPEQSGPVKDPNRRCGKCDSRELRRQNRSVLDRLLSIQPYKCGRCANEQKKFRFEWTSLLRALALLAAFGAAVYFWINPPSFNFRSGEVAASSEAEALARARTNMGGQLSTFEQMMTKKPKGTLDNATILQLWKANVGTNVILQMVRTSNANYDVSAQAIIELRQAQVDQTIILAMIDASYSSR